MLNLLADHIKYPWFFYSIVFMNRSSPPHTPRFVEANWALSKASSQQGEDPVFGAAVSLIINGSMAASR